MRLGFAPFRGSNPRASAPDQGVRTSVCAPWFMSVILPASIWHRNGTAGGFALPRDVAGDRRGGGVGELLGDLGVDVHRERDGAVAQITFGGCPAASSIVAAPCRSPCRATGGSSARAASVSNRVLTHPGLLSVRSVYAGPVASAVRTSVPASAARSGRTVGYGTRGCDAAAFPLVLSRIRTTPEWPPTTPSRPASVAWRWLGADVEAGGDDDGDERSRISASRYASVHMAAIASRLSAVPGCGQGCPRDRGRRSRECRTAARPAPGRPRRRRWPAAARRCHRGPWWPGGSSRKCPWPSSR